MKVYWCKGGTIAHWSLSFRSQINFVGVHMLSIGFTKRSTQFVYHAVLFEIVALSLFPCVSVGIIGNSHLITISKQRGVVFSASTKLISFYDRLGPHNCVSLEVDCACG